MWSPWKSLLRRLKMSFFCNSARDKQTEAKIRSHIIMWDLILAPARLQFLNSTDTSWSWMKVSEWAWFDVPPTQKGYTETWTSVLKYHPNDWWSGGIKVATPGLEAQCVIHWATDPLSWMKCLILSYFHQFPTKRYDRIIFLQKLPAFQIPIELCIEVSCLAKEYTYDWRSAEGRELRMVVTRGGNSPWAPPGQLWWCQGTARRLSGPLTAPLVAWSPQPG